MNNRDFRQELDDRIVRHDLLTHPFYQAWSTGQLTREDLRSYAVQYFHHVAAFPEYLEVFEGRLQADPLGLAEARELAQVVAQNRAEEEGQPSSEVCSHDGVSHEGRSHEDLWLDFAEGMGAARANVGSGSPLPEIQELIDTFQDIAREGLAAEALAAFYAYESQVPRIAQEKARGLKEMYGADSNTCAYFTVHQTADVYHANVWSEQLEKQVQVADPEVRGKALQTAERVAQALWRALDGIERERRARAA